MSTATVCHACGCSGVGAINGTTGRKEFRKARKPRTSAYDVVCSSPLQATKPFHAVAVADALFSGGLNAGCSECGCEAALRQPRGDLTKNNLRKRAHRKRYSNAAAS